jgi:hypothetical protein
MPKQSIDYSNAVFYKIYCKNPLISDVYVGITTNFIQRKYSHTRSCYDRQSPHYACTLYTAIRKFGSWDNWSIEIIATHNCSNRDGAYKQLSIYTAQLNARLTCSERRRLSGNKPLDKFPNSSKKVLSDSSHNFVCSELPRPTNRPSAAYNHRKPTETDFAPKKPPDLFTCEVCDYKCSKSRDYDRHLSTRKHSWKPNGVQRNTDFAPDIINKHICDICEREYKFRSGLWKHKQTCVATVDDKPPTEVVDRTPDDDISYKEMFLRMMSQNQELHKIIIEQHENHHKEIQELIPKLGNTTNNNQFNMQVFLHDRCKDALNLTEFMNSLHLGVDDLLDVGNLGYVDGISGILVKALKRMRITERPIHCTDYKREIVYIKEDDKWERDADGNPILQNTIKFIEQQNLNLLPNWQKSNPDFAKLDTASNKLFHKISMSALGGGEDQDKLNKKIFKHVLQEVSLNKKQLHGQIREE